MDVICLFGIFQSLNVFVPAADIPPSDFDMTCLISLFTQSFFQSEILEKISDGMD